MEQATSKADCIELYQAAGHATLLEISEDPAAYAPLRASLVRLLGEPLDEDDADFVEAAWGLIELVGEPDDWLEVVSRLLLQPHHREHEEIIGMLQQARRPESVPVLRKAIALKPQLAYLEYDDYGAYYKKCLWALHDIGTEEAIALIRECAGSNDAALKKQAEYRLGKMAGQGARK